MFINYSVHNGKSQWNPFHSAHCTREVGTESSAKFSMPTKWVFLLFLCCYHSEALGQCFSDMDQEPSEQMILEGMKEFFKASTSFSLHFFRALNHTSDLFFSPFSVWSTLVLVYIGSRKATERELSSVLGLKDIDKLIVAHSYQALQQWFSEHIISSPSKFSMVNKLFIHSDVIIRQCLMNHIGGELLFIDFYTDPELARHVINLWVQKNTKGKIQHILPPHSIQEYTKMVAASAIHFKGAWLQPFHPYATRLHPFYDYTRGYTMVDMMMTKDTFLYASSEDLQCSAIELPYKGRSLTMVVMLPNNKFHGIQILINSLTLPRLNNLTEDMFPYEIMVHIPKFQINNGLQLETPLRKMGLNELFKPSNVDLSGLTGSKDLEINAVYHKTHINVNEQGTEASASTAAAISRSSRPSRILAFVVDRPFVFYIRENYSGSILFMGVVYNPTYSTS